MCTTKDFRAFSELSNEYWTYLISKLKSFIKVVLTVANRDDVCVVSARRILSTFNPVVFQFYRISMLINIYFRTLRMPERLGHMLSYFKFPRLASKVCHVIWKRINGVNSLTSILWGFPIECDFFTRIVIVGWRINISQIGYDDYL